MGIFFDVDTQLSSDFCKYNNLYSNKDLNEDSEKTGYFSIKRRVKAQRFRGEKSEGYFVPISYLAYTYGKGHVMTGEEDIFDLKIGHEFNIWNDQEICQKYIIKYPDQGGGANSKGKSTNVEGFARHFDTDHFNRNMYKLDSNNDLYITEKLHGTSGRVARLKATYKPTMFSKIVDWFMSLFLWTRMEKYIYVAGSRRREFILDEPREGMNLWEQTGHKFKGLLLKGETLYFEIVGYDSSKSHARYNSEGVSTIMNSLNNKKLKSFLTRDEYKEFIDKYGEMTVFDYNLEKNESEVYLYRITMTDDNGNLREMPLEYVKSRAEELGINSVPVLARVNKELFINLHHEDRDEMLIKMVDEFTNSDSEIFKNHVREGVVVHQYDGLLEPRFLKSKSFLFKVLEGIIKEDSSVPDMEEAEQQV